MIPLPVLTCDGCGACCAGVGSPPGLLFDFGNPALLEAEAAGLPLSEWPLSEWGRSLPADALASLLDYYASGQQDRDERGLPCLWYDADAKRCRYYAHRPEACVEFEVGGEDCLRIRNLEGVR
jgi:Fe-S-cluster containining protein